MSELKKNVMSDLPTDTEIQLQEIQQDLEAGQQISDDSSPETPLYTTFKVWECYTIIIFASVVAIFSTISVPIYLPALPELEAEFGVTTEKINLTVVTYTLFQGIAPAFWSPLADHIGRRPIYIICCIVYIGACIGLALANSYALLLIMRALQAMGMATTIAIGAGVVGDLTTRANRGSYIGIFSGLSLVGGAIGPIIGGLLTHGFHTWRAIFWFLVIAAGIMLLVVVAVLPETGRFLVGNGLVRPSKTAWMSIAPMMLIRGHVWPQLKLQRFSTFEEARKKALLQNPAPTSFYRTFQILFEKDVALMLAPIGLHYTSWFMVITAQSTLLSDEYGMSALQIGFSYLANGAGSITGSLVSGRIMTMLYRRQVQKFRTEWEESHTKDEPVDMSEFNIQYARLSMAHYASLFVIFPSIIFGWTIQYHVHYLVPIFMTFIISFGAVCYMNMGSCLLVDLFPNESSTATACLNVVRCLLCGVGLAVVDKMILALKPGGTFTLMGGILVLSWFALFALIKFGHKWEHERMVRETQNSVESDIKKQ